MGNGAVPESLNSDTASLESVSQTIETMLPGPSGHDLSMRDASSGSISFSHALREELMESVCHYPMWSIPFGQKFTLRHLPLRLII